MIEDMIEDGVHPQVPTPLRTAAIVASRPGSSRTRTLNLQNWLSVLGSTIT